jgi:cytochrome c oxidase assembly protein subunit 15
MIHRYLAGGLGLAILLLTLLAWRQRNQADQPLLLPSLLLVLVILQAALGMWTVTLLVKPAIVTAHLLGGFATFALLWLLVLQLRPTHPLQRLQQVAPMRIHLWLALAVILLQISLGGWTSSNYAALGCSEFPTCYAGTWWPNMDFKEAFVIWRGLGVNYEFGVLEPEARSAIHMTHRIGALLSLILVGWLGLHLLARSETPGFRRLGWILLSLLGVQLGLGISNVLAQLPLPIALAHNGVAALLLVTLVTTLWLSHRQV